MDKQLIKENLRKTRFMNRKETGKRYMTKNQLCEVMTSMIKLNIPKEENIKIHKTESIGSILKGFVK